MTPSLGTPATSTKTGGLDFHEHSKFARRIRHGAYKFFHTLLITRCLANSATYVACDPDQPNVIYGFMVVQKPMGDQPAVLHYLYVKRAFRTKVDKRGYPISDSGMGVGQALMDNVGLTKESSFWFTHLTYTGETLWKQYPNAEYVPYAV